MDTQNLKNNISYKIIENTRPKYDVTLLKVCSFNHPNRKKSFPLVQIKF